MAKRIEVVLLEEKDWQVGVREIGDMSINWSGGLLTESEALQKANGNNIDCYVLGIPIIWYAHKKPEEKNSLLKTP